MTIESHHQATLIEAAKTELERAHRAVRALDGSEIRRGLQIALDSLREALIPAPGGVEPAVPPPDHLQHLVTTLEHALADLQAGKLAEMGNLIETARKQLES
jgi:hypothetical protein